MSDRPYLQMLQWMGHKIYRLALWKGPSGSSGSVYTTALKQADPVWIACSACNGSEPSSVVMHCSLTAADLAVQNMEAGMRDDQFARTPLTLHYPAAPHVSTPLLNF